MREEYVKRSPDAVLADVVAFNGTNTRDLVGLEVGCRVGWLDGRCEGRRVG